MNDQAWSLDRGKTFTNAIVRGLAQLLVVVVNLFITRFVISQMGIEAYGVVGSINSMINFTTIVTASLTSAVGRDVIFSLEKKDLLGAQKELNTAMFGVSGLLLLVSLIFLLGSGKLESIVRIPGRMHEDAHEFLMLSMVAFSMLTISGPLGASMFVRNRLDILGMAILVRTVLFAGFLMALFGYRGPTLESYGWAALSAAIVQLLLFYFIHTHLLPTIEIAVKYFRTDTLRKTLVVGGWLTLGQAATTLFSQSDVLIANQILGSREAGILAGLVLIPLQFRVVSYLVATLLTPGQTFLAAKSDWRKFAKYYLESLRITGMVFGFGVGVFCGSAPWVLNSWLGKDFGEAAPIAVLLSSHLVITLGSSISTGALMAINRVRFPALLSLCLGIINVGMSIWMAKAFGLIGIAVSGLIVQGTLNFVAIPWYISKNTHVRLSVHWREQILAMMFALFVAFVTGVVFLTLQPLTFSSLLISLSAASLVAVLLGLPYILWVVRSTPLIRQS
jgi:membrane protein EpsK